MLDRKTTLAVAIIASAGLVGSSVVVADAFGNPSRDVATEITHPSRAERAALDPSELGGLAASLNETFVSLADRVTPAVVRIEVQQNGEAVAPTPRFEVPEPFRRFFPQPDMQSQPEPTPRIAGGSGFLISNDGYIVTNDHVVEGGGDITVWLQDRHSYSAELVGADPTTDVAVIRIDGTDFPTLPWGSSDDLDVGEWVLAIGNPGVGNGRPLDYTVTSGIVSAKNRPLQLIERSLENNPDFGSGLAGYAIENFIQTDAVINPGNSGGPLVNLYGEVVGINSAIASTSGYYQGYGFAIPADLVRRVAQDLIEDGHVERAWLGVSVSGITPEDAEVYGLSDVSGVLVQSVTDDSPADHAGLESEDVIVRLDDQPVDRGGGLQQLVAEHRPGQTVTLGIIRDGRHMDVRVELGEAPLREDRASNSGGHRSPGSATLDRLGIDVQNLTGPIANQLGYDDASGVVVSDVEPAGPAARRGVRPGLRVLEVNRTEIDSVETLGKVLDHVDQGDVVTLRLQSPDGTTSVVNIRAR